MAYSKITIIDNDNDRTEWNLTDGKLDLTKHTGQAFPFGTQPERAEMFIAIEELSRILIKHPYKEFKIEYSE